jgi:uncharacterized protein (TIGR02757 family)
MNRPEFILNDPVQFPRSYRDPADIEIAAFLTAAIAWGRRDLILRSAKRMFALMEPGPAAFVMSGDYRGLKDRCVHRTFFEGDLKYFCRGLRACYAQYGSLEALFASAAANPAAGAKTETPAGIWEGIGLFRETMARANNGLYTKHIANPESSACKRVNLALRWLIRPRGPVDIGLWKSVSPSALCIPLDLHVARSARRLGLLARKSNDRKAVMELTENLRGLCPDDPVKYDLALFGLSVQ